MGRLNIDLPPHQPLVSILDNGLEVLLKPDPEAPIASVQVWVRAGSMHEAPWLGAGLSHLLEHMLFNGTESRDGTSLTRDVQAAGAYINAYTSLDRTVYWIEAPAESVPVSLDLLADMTLHSTLPEEAFKKELDVIRREMAMGDDSPAGVCTKLMFASTFQAHPIRHPVIGYREVFDRITHQDLVAYYRAQYVPNNMFVVVAGNFDAKQTLEDIERLFGDAKRAPLAPKWLPPEPRQQGLRVQHREGPSQHSHLRIAWHAPGAMDDDTGALDLISTILGGGRSSRLYRELRERQALVHGTGAFLYSLSDVGLFVISAETDPDKRIPAEEAIRLEVARLLDEGVSDAEFDKALHLSLADALDDLTTTRGVAGDIGSSWLLSGHPEFTRHYLEVLQELDPERLLAVARRYLVPRNCTVVSLNPEGSSVAAAASKTRAQPEPVRRHLLENGLTLLVKADPRLPLVTLHSAFRGGLLAETGETAGLTRLFARMLTRDAGDRSAEEIAEAVESLGGDFNSFAGYNSFGLSLEALAPHWRDGLEILAAGLTAPKFPAGALQREINLQSAAIRAERDRPMTTALKLMRENLFAGHPYQFPAGGTESTIKTLTQTHLDQYRTGNVLGGNGVIAVYGAVDPDEVREAVEFLFAPIPQGDRRFDHPPAVPDLKESKRVEAEHDKEQAVVIAAYPTGGFAHPDTPTLELICDAVGDMSSPLYTRIREELGAAYSVGAQRMLGYEGGCFFFYAATSREQAPEVEKALFEEIDRLAREGLPEDELQRARKSWHGEHLNRLQTVASLAKVHTLDELLDLGWDHAHRAPDGIDAISSPQTQEVAQRYFADRPHVFVSLLPSKNSPQ